MTIQLPQTTFSGEDIKAFEPAMKIGLLATVSANGLPHLTLISTLKAGSADTVTWGQFTEGMSKQHVLQNPKTSFMIMTLDKQVWRGKALYDHSTKGGTDFDWYNNVPMFRYNAYFGIHTVHYMNLIGHTGKRPLPMNSIILAAVKTLIARTLSPDRVPQEVMNAWTRGLFNKLDNLKFLSWVDQDGYPWIVPVIQAQASGSQNILFSTSVFGDELAMIPMGAPIALFGMALTMEDVLVRGEFMGISRHAGLKCADVKVNWVYNPMPPVPGQIYPQVELAAVKNF